jgi:hypothetical protein
MRVTVTKLNEDHYQVTLGDRPAAMIERATYPSGREGWTITAGQTSVWYTSLEQALWDVSAYAEDFFGNQDVDRAGDDPYGGNGPGEHHPDG